MKALMVTSRNIRHNIIVAKDGEDKIEPEIEAILTLVGKSMQFAGHGYTNAEFTETVRFALSPEGARKLADSLQSWADEAEEEAKRFEIANKDA